MCGRRMHLRRGHEATNEVVVRIRRSGFGLDSEENLKLGGKRAVG